MILTLDKEFEILEDRRTDAKITEARLHEFQQKIKKIVHLEKRMEEKMKSEMRRKN